MKKFFVLFLTIALFTTTVSADILIEIDDSFWEQNKNNCDYLYRSYTINSPEGYAAIWESPISSRQKETLVNGKTIGGIWHYTDNLGEIWCAVQTGEMDHRGYEKISGWIKTSECLPIPDYISFREAHEQEFVGYDHSYDHAFEDLEQVTLWVYPCSGRITSEQVDARWFRENTIPAETFSTCWEDSHGRLWAFVNYCYGIRNTWICLDDPASTELEADETVLPQDAVIYPPIDQAPPPKNEIASFTIGAVLAVTVVSAGLLWIFFVKKRSLSS